MFTKVAAAGGFSCGLGDDNGIYCWGANTNRELGDGTTTSRLRPTQVGTSKDWIDVDARFFAACGIQRDHSMWCWGRGTVGQLGDGTSTTVGTPTKVVSDKPGIGWSKMALGRETNCGIHEDGSLACWGRDLIGGGTVAAPVAVDDNKDWTAVSVGTVMCGIRGVAGSPGALYCWGHSTNGELGLGATTSQATPARVGTDTWEHVEVGYYNTCGIRSDHALLCWGNHIFQGILQYGDTPRQLGTATDWESISLGSDTFIGLRNGGTAFAWGYNDAGQLGQPAQSEVAEPSPVGGSVTGWSDISAGNVHSCGIANGHLYCWGMVGDGYLGDGATSYLYVPTKIGSEQWSSVTAGLSQCGLRKDGALLCWGSSSSGFDSTVPTWSPTRLGSDTWTSAVSSYASFGAGATCAIRGGVPYCWGDNFDGGLGVGHINSPLLTPVAVKVPAGTQWTEIAPGGHTCAIQSDATLWCWGANYGGQLGTGTADAPTLEPVAPLPGAWLHVAVVEYGAPDKAVTCGIKTDHSLWCWGTAPDGTQQLVPTQVGVDKTWVSLSMGSSQADGFEGGFRACAVRAGGTLWCWGNRLGDGTANHSAVPVQVGAASDWKSVAVGGKVCAIKTGGTLWCWGNYSLLGAGAPAYDPDGAIVTATVPTQIGNEADWSTVTGSAFFDTVSCATKADGSLWCWGATAAALPGFVTTPVQIN